MICSCRQRFAELGVALEAIAEFDQGFEISSAGSGDGLEELIFDSVSRIRCGLRERRRTAGAKSVVILQRGLTSGTSIEARSGDSGVGRLDVVVVENEIVELLVTDARVGIDLIRVDIPARAMFDGLLAHPLSDPSADRGLSEVVRVHAISGDAGLIGDGLDPSREILIGHRPIAVVIGIVVALLDVDERGVVDIAAWMHIQIPGDVAFRPSHRDGSRGTFDVGVLVDRDHARLARQVDIADPQRGDRSDPQSCVGQQGDERFIARVRTGIEEIVDLFVGQQLVGIDRLRLGGADLDVLAEVDLALLEELPEGFAIVPERAVREIVLVPQVEDQLIHVGLVHLDERHVAALGRESESVEVRDHRPLVHVTASVDGTDELVDGLAVALVDVGLLQLLKLVFEFGPVVLYVVGSDHEKGVPREDYETSSSSSTRTTRKNYIIQPGSTAANGGSAWA